MLQRAVTFAVVGVFCVGVLGALTVDPSDGELQVRTAAPSTTTIVEELPVETTTTTSTTIVPVSTTALPVARPKPKPTTTTTQAAQQQSGHYPGSVSFPFQAGRTSWAGTSFGHDLAVSVDTATPRSGVPVTFTLTVAHPHKKCCSYGFSTGDGGVYSDNGDCPGKEPPGSLTWTITRAYNKAGRWKFTFSGGTNDCQGLLNEYPYMYGWIEVAPGGPATSQGPSLPTFKTFGRMGPTQYDNDHSYLTVIAQVTDTDGYVFKIVVDWGDGTSETFPEKDMGCRQAPSGWPQESFMKTPTDPAPVHHYAQQGTYKVTATAYSSGCDGRDVQQASSSFDWVY